MLWSYAAWYPRTCTMVVRRRDVSERLLNANRLNIFRKWRCVDSNHYLRMSCPSLSGRALPARSTGVLGYRQSLEGEEPVVTSQVTWNGQKRSPFTLVTPS